jgi:hypothetical protein
MMECCEKVIIILFLVIYVYIFIYIYTNTARGLLANINVSIYIYNTLHKTIKEQDQNRLASQLKTYSFIAFDIT